MAAKSRRKADVEPAEPHLSQRDWHARAMHRSVDVVCDAWPRASEDVQAIGFPSAVMQPRSHATAELTSVEAAAVRGLRFGDAVGWIAELHDVAFALLAAGWPNRSFSIDWTPVGLRPVLHTAVDRIAAGWTLDDLVDFDPRSANYRSDVFGLGRLAGRALRYWPPPPPRGSREGGVTVGERSSSVETCGLCGDPVVGGRNDPIRRIDGQAFHGKSCWFTVTRQRQQKVS